MFNENFLCPGCGKTRVFTRFCTELPWSPTPNATTVDYKLCGCCLSLSRSPILKVRQKIKAKIDKVIRTWWEKTVVAQLDEELDAIRVLDGEKAAVIERSAAAAIARTAAITCGERERIEAEKQRDHREKRNNAKAIVNLPRVLYGPGSAREKRRELDKAGVKK